MGCASRYASSLGAQLGMLPPPFFGGGCYVLVKVDATPSAEESNLEKYGGLFGSKSVSKESFKESSSETSAVAFSGGCITIDLLLCCHQFLASRLENVRFLFNNLLT
ncbi:hypothetical protein TNCT_146891 [Trichonephila clavata]|uniref:Uncharacterized protein n=1 Tax=Trichonephila clavata TaxID=2740835 RepID=A0A8X6GZM8_TRICU|nr:hypothetical protein TNCT_146891 [Trichonephila clavata]